MRLHGGYFKKVSIMEGNTFGHVDILVDNPAEIIKLPFSGSL